MRIFFKGVLIFSIVLWGTVTTLNIVSHVNGLVVKREIVSEEYNKTGIISKIGKSFLDNNVIKIERVCNEVTMLNEYLHSESFANRDIILTKISELKQIVEKIRISSSKEFANLNTFRILVNDFLVYIDDYLLLVDIIMTEHNYKNSDDLSELEKKIINKRDDILKFIKTLEVV